MNKKNDKYSCIRIIVYIVMIIFLILLVNEKIKTSCYWYDNYGFLCPTCGITRATISILHLEIMKAISYNFYYTCILFPLAMFYIFNDIFVVLARLLFKQERLSHIEKITSKNGKNKKAYSIFFIILFILFITYGILRNFI